MINLSKEVCYKIAEARREEGLSQSDVAREVGCAQSAISMFEKGDITKLSEETVKRLSERFNIPLEFEKTPAVSGMIVNTVRGYCPDSSCISNIPYTVGGKIYFRPSRSIASPNGGKFCSCCGEVLEKRCPVCNAPLNDGACCTLCGSVYVTPALPEDIDIQVYVKSRIEEITKFRSII